MTDPTPRELAEEIAAGDPEALLPDDDEPTDAEWMWAIR